MSSIVWTQSSTVKVMKLLILLLTVSATSCSECNIFDNMSSYNLDSLKGFIWNTTVINGTEALEFRFSLCQPLQEPLACRGSSLCSVRASDGFPTNLGDFNISNTKITEGIRDGFWASFEGPMCPDGGLYHTIVKFECGKNLGLPKVLHLAPCSSSFLWVTSAACRQVNPRNEVPCYVHDSHGDTYDLTPLIKSSGAYPLSSSSGSQFHINVCAETVPDAAVPACPNGSGACRFSGKNVTGYGYVRTPLFLTPNGDLRITYRSYDGPIPDGCDQPPRTNITFICPLVAGGGLPTVISNLNCKLNVEWITEFACPTIKTQSRDTCQLFDEVHGLNVDLTPTTAIDGPHSIESNSSGTAHQFYLSLCGGLPSNFTCSNMTGSAVTACLKIPGDESGEIIGKRDESLLRFSDGELTFVSRSVGRKPCGEMITVVHLKCSPLSIGEPVFLRGDDCTFFFEWKTKAACVDFILGSQCHVLNESGIVDLSSLRKRPGESSWEVVSAPDVERARSDISRIFLNVCGAVGRVPGSLECPVGAAVCVHSRNGTRQNFGKFVRLPSVDPFSGHVQIVYTDGDPCPLNPSLNRTTTITFVCWPGWKDRSPRKVHVSRDGCSLEIEWITMAGCVKGFVQGNGCKIEDPKLGFSFDLSPLRRDSYYTVSANGYEYFLNICGPLRGSDVPCVTPDDQLVSACQVPTTNRTKGWSLGDTSEVISSFNGILNLTYTRGPRGEDAPEDFRKTEIIFECEHDAGIGKPTFLKVTDNTHRFLWKTLYACPPRPVQCIVSDSKGVRYDLSRLSRGYGEENWIIDAETQSGYERYYVNACGRIGNAAPAGCYPNAGACATRISNNSESVFVENMGEPLEPPFVEKEQLILKLVNGSRCASNPSKNHGTTIYFMCSHEPIDKGSSIALLRKLPCETIFSWMTKAACPLSGTRPATTRNSCSLFNPYSGFTLNLSPFNESLNATVQDNENSKEFTINICGTVSPTSCRLQPGEATDGVSVCGFGSNEKDGFVVGMSTTRTLEALTEDVISVRFNATWQKTDYDVEVIVKCRRHLDHGSLRFKRRAGDSYLFELETSVVCPPESVDCVVEDDTANRRYDLTPLEKTTSNWFVTDGRPGKQDIYYVINVCRASNGDGILPTCPGVNVGACTVDRESGKPVVVGHVQSKPRVAADGIVTLRYLHGEPCGLGEFSYSMRINFICSPVDEDPQFVDITPECEVVVHWKTTAACPIEKHVGSDCKVSIPNDETTYDFNKLRKTAGYIFDHSNQRFTINLCGPLENGCRGSNNSAVCVTSDNEEKSAGRFSGNVTYQNGIFTLRYEGDQPDEGTVVTLTCNRSTDGSQGPSYTGSTEDGSFVFVWPTSYACPSYKKSECHVWGHDGKLYELHRLMSRERNRVYLSPDKKMKYFINVCHSVIPSEDLNCPYGIAACALNLSAVNPNSRILNLGEVGQGPELEDGALRIRYGNGGPCRFANGTVSSYSTEIRFFCHTKESEPTLVTEDGCQLRFDWFTPAACPSNVADNVGVNCAVSDPLTGYRFNLSSLRTVQDPYGVQLDGGAEALISVCGPVNRNLCGSNSSLTGSCLVSNDGETKTYVNIGVANSQLTRRGDVIFLNYSDGQGCRDGVARRNTLITFMCGEEGSGNGQPVFAGTSDNCTYFFNWKTEIACETNLECVVESRNETYDLKVLSQISEPPVAVSMPNTQGVFLINVCRPLILGPRINCPAGAAACHLRLGAHNGLNLGHAMKEPFVDNQGHITLEYEHGSPCPANPRINASSRILFICQEGSEKGVPELVEVTEGCVYVFQWRTYVVCPKVPPNRNCGHVDPKTRFTLDLNLMFTHETTVTYNETPFTLNPCGHMLDDAAVRSQTGSWGSALSVRSWYDGFVFGFNYTDGDKCTGGGRKSSQIRIICEYGVKVGQPQLVTISECGVAFDWRTELACRSSGSSCVTFLPESNSMVDLRYLTSPSIPWITNDTEGNSYTMNICSGIIPAQVSETCTSSSTVCVRNAQSGEVYELGNLATERITAETDAVKVSYTSRSDACGPGMFTQVTITLVCGPLLGQPQLISKVNTSDACNFDFAWKTRVVCARASFRQVYTHNGLVEDPEYRWTADLTSIFKKTFEVAKNRVNAAVTYTVNLNGLNFPCNGSTICFNTSAEPNSFVGVGLANSRKLYAHDTELIADFKTETRCSRNPNKSVSSSIIFGCSPHSGQGNPEFVYESEDCHFAFSWETNLTCSTVKSFLNETNQDADTAYSYRGAITSVVILAFILSIIAVIIKFDAGKCLRTRVRKLFCRQSSPDGTLEYSVLLDSEGSSLLDRCPKEIPMQKLSGNGEDLVQ